MKHKSKLIVTFLWASLSIVGVPLIQPANGSQTIAYDVTATAADQRFIDGMVPHHEMALTMADDALKHAQHADLRAFAKQVKRAQSKEIASMKHWRSDWFGAAAVPEPSPMAMSHPTPGPTFDREWMAAMIVHHQAAVEMSAKAALTRPELKQLAKAIQKNQRREQSQLRRWIKAWYVK